MKRYSKNYVESSKNIDKHKLYDYAEAIKLVKSLSKTKFDSTIEIAMRLNLDTKKADQQLRGSLVLPNGTGKTRKVLVVTKNAQEEAKKAGADYVGEADMLEKIEKENWFDFDIIVATPDMMASLGKLGKILGPKGLMPNPKTGTVTTNVTEAVNNIKKGMVEYRADVYGNVHGVIGKTSFTEKALEENFLYFVNEIIRNKPSGAKGTYIKNISIASTMGPGVKIDKNSIEN